MTIGISVSRDQLLAVVLDDAAPSPRAAAVVAVPCREPFGAADEAVVLAGRLREAIPDGVLPGAVITLPPAMTYLRPLKLPVTDLHRARGIHLGELEGNLPIEDEEILSDLLPSSPAAPDTFLAVAARKSQVERTVEAFQAAGIRVDLVVTDHAALLAVASGKVPDDALLLSAFSDILLMRVSGGGVRAARQFPEAMSETPADILAAIVEAARDEGPVPSLVSVGVLPAPLERNLPGPTPLPLPEDVPASHLAAFGAAIAPASQKALGGFSLRTSAEAAAEKVREGRKVRIAAVAAAVAVLFALAALEFSVWVSGRKLAKVRDQVRGEFSQVAPDVKLRDATMESQIQGKIASLKRLQKELGTEAPPPADLLALASSSLPQGDIAVREASVEGGRVRLAGETADSRLVESYRAGLSKSFGPGYAATLQGTEAGLKGGAVKFTILVEKKEVPGAS